MRHIDHIVVAVRDLDQAGEFYRRLGFQVGVRNRHPWGTENRLIQFGLSFIELITVEGDNQKIPPHTERRFSFGAFVRDYLSVREGLAMLSLNSDNAEADAAHFAKSGIGDFEPFFFARKARKSDGTETQVAFTLAFAQDPTARDAGFFVCQQHNPENFWNKTFQHHPNGACGVSAVALTALEPEKHAAFLAGFCDTGKRYGFGGNLEFALDGGKVEAIHATDEHADMFAPSLLTSFTVRIKDVQKLTDILATERIPFTALDTGGVLLQDLIFGVEMRFESEIAGYPIQATERKRVE